MTDWTPLYVVMAVVGSLLVAYPVQIQLARKALNQEAKGQAIQKVFTELGFRNIKLKDFNDLNEKGLAMLVTVMREVRGPMGGAAMTPDLQMLLALGQLQNPQPQGGPGVPVQAGPGK